MIDVLFLTYILFRQTEKATLYASPFAVEKSFRPPLTDMRVTGAASFPAPSDGHACHGGTASFSAPSDEGACGQNHIKSDLLMFAGER